MATENDRFWAGFDLGGTKMLATIYDAEFNKLGRKRKRTKGHEGAENGVQRIAATLRQALEETEVPADRLAGIGIGCPAPVDTERGVILDAVNLGWKDVALRKKLESEFDCPVVVVNDVDAGVFAENRFGAARKARCVVGIFPGTGIGGGAVYDGQIVRGSRVSAMEIGHMLVTPGGRLCGCGLRGCLETEASRLSISAEVAKAAYRGEAPRIMELAGTDLSNIRSGVLADAIEAGDAVVEDIIRHAGGKMGVALASIVHLLVPDRIVLGGGLVEAMPKLMVDSVTKTLRRNVMPAMADTFKVVPAELGDDASVLGAAAWAAQTFGSEPAEPAAPERASP